jgi:hypothetical protein
MGNNEGSGRRLDIFEIIQFERSADGKVINIGERQRVVEVIRLDLRKDLKKALDFEYCAGIFVVHDITEECKDKTCKIPGCQEEAQVLEARLVAVTSPEGDDYLLGEIEPEAREILTSTRKSVRICSNHKLESLLNGSQAEDYEEIVELPETDNVVALRGLPKRPMVAMEDSEN